MNKWKQLSEGESNDAQSSSVLSPPPPSSSSSSSSLSLKKYRHKAESNEDFGEMITINFSDDAPDIDNDNNDDNNNQNSTVCGATMNFINRYAIMLFLLIQYNHNTFFIQHSGGWYYRYTICNKSMRLLHGISNANIDSLFNQS
jgi:hypothetical protein